MPFDQRLLVDILATKTRQLPELTTSWCPQRQEHRYLFAPVFKPSTHRWSAVDVMARLNKPIGDHIPPTILSKSDAKISEQNVFVTRTEVGTMPVYIKLSDYTISARMDGKLYRTKSLSQFPRRIGSTLTNLLLSRPLNC